MTRQDINFKIDDYKRGNMRVRVIDRITPDDVVLHLMEREFFKLKGGKDPGDELNVEFKDFLVRSGNPPW